MRKYTLTNLFLTSFLTMTFTQLLSRDLPITDLHWILFFIGTAIIISMMLFRLFMQKKKQRK
ncbi:hypothetical protein [Apilactobacillus timberlakei]|uniref:Uncharacterized protein n=1 Tax=Apilactobacillus timberlakei TaxID=2008380 RepID=A0ABY2YS69_9LACO|nr:hypothetical protein [Apilactobacillus timberlakei]TPR12779.1 hypothetical protein DY048_07150 [Apilactobacillus timberlakei]TPR13662.1 hypothetical protein DY052_08020 [Apilactobacillus timberlakei]